MIRLLFVLFLLTACARPIPTATRTVYLNGDDPATGTVINPINIWSSYAPRGKVVARLAHGSTVTLVRHQNGGALIRWSGGEGWVGDAFISLIPVR